MLAASELSMLDACFDFSESLHKTKDNRNKW